MLSSVTKVLCTGRNTGKVEQRTTTYTEHTHWVLALLRRCWDTCCRVNLMRILLPFPTHFQDGYLFTQSQQLFGASMMQPLAALKTPQHEGYKKDSEPVVKLIPPKGEIGWLLQWRDSIPSYPLPLSLPSGSFHSSHVPDIVSLNLQEYAHDIQALLLNIDWSKNSLDRFRKLNLTDKLMSGGMVFVWTEKENMASVMDHLEKFDINYVEIFTMAFLSLQKIKALDKPKSEKGTLLSFFAKKSGPPKEKTIQDYLDMPSHLFPPLTVDQVIYTGGSQFLRKSKRNLLLLRKLNKKQPLQLRHQRTSDVFFSLFDQETQKMDPASEECVYRMIETLLIKANYVPGEPLRMMELWSRKGQQREGWISISEEEGQL